MSAQRQRGYHFASAAQWKACLLSQADVSGMESGVTVRPFAPYQSIAVPSFPSRGAFAPAFSRSHEVLWHDSVGQLHRLLENYDKPESVKAPAAILRAQRMIAASSDLWVAGDAPQSLQCFDAETLSRRFAVDLGQASVIDIAADARNGVVALVERGGVLECLHVDCAGTIGSTIALEGLADARAFVFLRGLGRFAVITRDAERLFWFSEAGGAPLWRTQLAMFAPCIVAGAVASDARKRVFVAGTDRTSKGSGSRVLVFDGDGAPIDDVALPETATGLAAASGSLLVTTQRGLYWLSIADPVPIDIPEVRAVILTPVLEAPDAEDGRRWLRAEVAADLPAGTTMEIACTTTDDEAERDRLQAIAEDATVPTGRRLQQLRAEAIWREPMVFHGGATSTRESGVPFATPLYDVRDRFVWLRITLTSGAGAKLPSLSRLSVLYPGRTLMLNMPSIYQREESQPVKFLRTLVGVLETTTQTLDARISAMGGNIHPQTAPPEWLDFIARWLGLPWDDALDSRQKKCIVAHAAQIAEGRGTRVGLETLLACLLPDGTSRFRITDMTVDYGIASVGGGACRGSSLPALLGGLPSSAARLGVRATLGLMRLPRGDTEEDATSRLVGTIRIDVAASAQEREQWSPWLESVLGAMVPITARMMVRWLGIDALRSNRLDDEAFIIEAPPAPRLGTDAVVGRTHLPDRAAALPASATDAQPRLH